MIIFPDEFTDEERELVPRVLEHLRDARDRVEQKFLDEVEEVFARPKIEPLLSGFQAHEEIGMGVVNTGAVKKLELKTWGKSKVSEVLEQKQKMEAMQKMYDDGLISQQYFLDMAGLPTPDRDTFRQEILGEFQPAEDSVFDESDVVRRSREASGVRGSPSHRRPVPGRLRSRHGNLGSQETAADAQPVQSVPRFRTREETQMNRWRPPEMPIVPVREDESLENVQEIGDEEWERVMEEARKDVEARSSHRSGHPAVAAEHGGQDGQDVRQGSPGGSEEA